MTSVCGPQGYTVLRGVVGQRTLVGLRGLTERGIAQMAQQLGVSVERYEQVVSIWDNANPLVQYLTNLVRPPLSGVLDHLGITDAVPIEGMLFRKSRCGVAPTHAHQDVAYRFNRPRYALTTWLALDDAGPHSGALQVLPDSHLEPIGVRVDHPAQVHRERHREPDWQARVQTLEAKAGDVVVFDGRLWHATCPSAPGQLRRAFAVRWTTGEELTWDVPAPARDPAVFGMDTFTGMLRDAMQQHYGVPCADDDALPGAVRAAIDVAECRAAPAEDLATLHDVAILLGATREHAGLAQSGPLWSRIRALVEGPRPAAVPA